MKLRFLICVSFVLGVSCFGFNALAVSPSKLETWRTFRAQHPYHIQIVGLSEADEQQHKLLIITEPPPHVTVEGLQRLNPSVLQDCRIGRQQIGYDGWVKDILVDLPPMSERDTELLVDRIHQYLFGTSYKATAVPISGRSQTVSAKQYDLDLHVPAGNISSWLLGPASAGLGGSRIVALIILSLLTLVFVVLSRRKKLLVVGLILGNCILCLLIAKSSSSQDKSIRFSPNEGGPMLNAMSILKKGTSGIFFSETPGLVVWSFPRLSSLSTFSLEARQFSLDSDLIIGAIASAQQIAIVGRERVVPVWQLPPLRVETIMLLASSNTDELAQSYERNNIFAGNYDKKRGLDWAPIYLSPQLIDTEYGSLLNITDQLLKSWSLNGQVKYINFNYPNPSTWPFPAPLNIHAHTREVTFNWNTKGAGYSVTKDGMEIFALNRTGALPIDYLSRDNQQLQRAENDGYKFFSSQSDPNLVRVVQYAALYQIFRRFKITAPAASQVNLPPSESLKIEARVLLSFLKSISDDTFLRVSDALEQAAGGQSQSRVDLEDTRNEIQQLRDNRDALIVFLQEWKEDGMNLLAADLAAPREQNSISKETLAQVQDARSDSERNQLIRRMAPQTRMALEAKMLAARISAQKSLLQGLAEPPLGTIMGGYLQDLRHPERGWIRTPSIVVSHAIGKLAGAVGGHNLDSAISVFRVSEDVAAGEIRVVEEGGVKVVLHNAEDTGRISELVRTAGKEAAVKSDAELAVDLQSALKNAATLEDVPVNNLLGFTREFQPSSLRGMDETMAKNVLEHSGYRAVGIEPTVDQKLLSDLLSSESHRAVVVERTAGSDKYLIFENTSRRIFEAHDVASAQDAVRACIRRAALDDVPVKLHLRGFDVRQGKGFIDTTELGVGEIRPKGITKTIDESRLTSSELSDILKTDYDFKSATIEEVHPILQDEAGSLVELEVKVPARAIAKSSLRIRFRLFIEKGVTFTQEALNAILDSVRQFVVKLSSGPDDLINPATKFIKDMEKTHPGLKLDIMLSRENKDIHIVYVKPPNISRREACPSA